MGLLGKGVNCQVSNGRGRRPSITFTLLYKANLCDLSPGHAHQRDLASFRHSSLVVINRLACWLLGEFEGKETKRAVF